MFHFFFIFCVWFITLAQLAGTTNQPTDRSIDWLAACMTQFHNSPFKVQCTLHNNNNSPFFCHFIFYPFFHSSFEAHSTMFLRNLMEMWTEVSEQKKMVLKCFFSNAQWKENRNRKEFLMRWFHVAKPHTASQNHVFFPRWRRFSETQQCTFQFQMNKNVIRSMKIVEKSIQNGCESIF